MVVQERGSGEEDLDNSCVSGFKRLGCILVTEGTVRKINILSAKCY